MAVTLTGGEGIFQRFSRAYKEYVRVVTAYGSALNSGVDDLYEEYATGADDIAINGLPALRESYRSVHSSYLSGLVSVMNTTFIEQVHRDTPLASKTINNALIELIRQMKASGDDFNRPTISASLAHYAGNAGDGTFVTSMTNGYGDPVDMCMAEDIKFTCTGDTSTGTTQYRETYSYVGEPLLPTTDYQWPGGSGANGTMTLFDAGSETSLIANGGFDTWSNASAAPDSSWTAVLGAFGTTLVRSTDNKRGTYALALTSDGSTLLGVKQVLSSTLVKPNQVILYNMWAKKSANDASGVLRIRLVDGNGTAITNDAGTTQAATYTLASGGDIATTYTNLTGSFQTPRQLPSTGVYVRVEYSVSPANGIVTTVDLVGLKIGTQVYAGGPFVAGFSGATNNAVTDYSTITVANDATVNFFVKALDRFFDLRTKGLYFPSAASESIADSLLTA